MKIFKSHFWYHKRQRDGVLFLILIIIILQIFYVFVDFSSNKKVEIAPGELVVFESAIDSLKKIVLESKKSKKYYFNPNYITDYRGYQLGMTVQEIDRLHKYRKQHKFINSACEFQKITKISDSLLSEISSQFKFPEWVVKRNKLKQQRYSSVVNFVNENEGLKISTDDINQASQKDLELISGVGKLISQRIIKYRNRLQGFSYKSQLYEVWGVNKETINKVLKVFKIYKKPVIKRININTASFKELLKNPYINYELCKNIFEYRDEVAELQNISEIKNIDGFPVDKYDRIVLYLKAE
ncbi:ComEA family DNA-binding protein [Tenacibaculum aestuariivivum]|uniref:ComEA family DNA-binding protein n=1 Tax=Tenacibaculum aestuariivivum TaxID=2006131 RepID=UPI003AB201D6